MGGWGCVEAWCLALRLLTTPPHYDVGQTVGVPKDRVVVTVDRLQDVLRDSSPRLTFTVRF